MVYRQGAGNNEEERHVKRINELVGQFGRLRRIDPIARQSASKDMSEDYKRYRDAFRRIEECHSATGVLIGSHFANVD